MAGIPQPLAPRPALPHCTMDTLPENTARHPPAPTHHIPCSAALTGNNIAHCQKQRAETRAAGPPGARNGNPQHKNCATHTRAPAPHRNTRTTAIIFARCPRPSPPSRVHRGRRGRPSQRQNRSAVTIARRTLWQGRLATPPTATPIACAAVCATTPSNYAQPAAPGHRRRHRHGEYRPQTPPHIPGRPYCSTSFRDTSTEHAAQHYPSLTEMSLTAAATPCPAATVATAARGHPVPSIPCPRHFISNVRRAGQGLGQSCASQEGGGCCAVVRCFLRTRAAIPRSPRGCRRAT